MEIKREIPVSIYYQLKNILKKHLIKKCRPDEKFFSERELADKFSVSRGSACRVIEQLVSEGFLYRLQGKGTFVASSGTSETNNNSIGLILPFSDIEDKTYAGIIKGVEEVASHEGYDVIFSNSRNSFQIEKKHLHRLKKVTRGIIFYPCDDFRHYRDTEKMLHQFQEERSPLVLIDRHFENIPLPSVETDNFWGAYQATQYLVQKGHRNIAHITPSPKWELLTSLRDRMRGYKKALQEHHLDDSRIIILPWEPGKKALNSAVRFIQDNAITAVFAARCGLAMKLVKSARQKGLGISDKLAITGFDKPIPEQVLPLLSVLQPYEKIGGNACRLLIGWIARKRIPDKCTLKPSLIYAPGQN